MLEPKLSYTYAMPSGIAAAPIDVAAVQAALAADGLDGWLLYDFRGLNPIAAEVTAVAHQGGHLATPALVLPDSGSRRAARAGSRDRARLAGAPARHDSSATPAANSSTTACGSSWRGCGAWRWSIRPTARSRTSRGSTPAPSSSFGSRRRGRVVGRSGAAIRGGLGRGGDRDASRGVREALPGQGSRVRRDRAPARATASPTTEYDIQQLMAGWFRGRRAGQRLGPERVGGGKRRQPALPADGDGASRRFGRTSWCCSTSGASSIVPARCLLTSPGSASPGARAPERYVQAFAAVRGGARRRGRAGAAGGRGRPGAARLAGRSRRLARAAERRLRRSHPAPHGPQPRRVGARQRREHGRLRNARRSAAAARHRLHD